MEVNVSRFSCAYVQWQWLTSGLGRIAIYPEDTAPDVAQLPRRHSGTGGDEEQPKTHSSRGCTIQGAAAAATEGERQVDISEPHDAPALAAHAEAVPWLPGLPPRPFLPVTLPASPLRTWRERIVCWVAGHYGYRPGDEVHEPYWGRMPLIPFTGTNPLHRSTLPQPAAMYAYGSPSSKPPPLSSRGPITLS